MATRARGHQSGSAKTRGLASYFFEGNARWVLAWVWGAYGVSSHLSRDCGPLSLHVNG